MLTETPARRTQPERYLMMFAKLLRPMDEDAVSSRIHLEFVDLPGRKLVIIPMWAARAS
jgi:hypothetical protein